ncbi:hypothetical protein KP509_03G050400 [Ceratopteris richardii]|uniref:Uncharacterized protein n=1 Tax=Ceratopteris richardii TaxID=49495 RepID=A0A8T2V748_CERRI|nr:hypothetical protein KP509_03G050400 [Ceratopteris richardii]
MEQGWRSAYLDAILVPLGVMMVITYNGHIAYRAWKAPATTEFGLYHLALHSWAHSISKDGLKEGEFVVQTMRNSILSSSILAAAAITLTTMTGVAVTNYRKMILSGRVNALMLGERGLTIGPEIKLAMLVPCFMLSSMCYVHSSTFYSNISLLLGMLGQPSSVPIANKQLKKSLVSASIFRCVGNRAFVISFPLLAWLYGPVPMFCTSLLIVTILYLQDTTYLKKRGKLQPTFSAPSAHSFAEESPLICIGPLPSDSVCLFCPHS